MSSIRKEKIDFTGRRLVHDSFHRCDDDGGDDSHLAKIYVYIYIIYVFFGCRKSLRAVPNALYCRQRLVFIVSRTGVCRRRQRAKKQTKIKYNCGTVRYASAVETFRDAKCR